MYTKIPPAFANLTRLTYLNLSNAMFSGPITTQFSNLISLNYSSISLNLSSSLEIQSDAYYSYLEGGSLSLSSLNFIQGLYNLEQLALSGVDMSMASQSTKWANRLSFLSNPWGL
ncbi:hypothetical protein Pint_11472 [Pistacia integerrima]|uniref:Uncharacterized protein n=1 Tax=Pistacia integerrima TaxID=434235 RepID=A0ACC0XLM1_9ROSI|nr:hypothetical protein Pint_11472 [Pistacia integerrima]